MYIYIFLSIVCLSVCLTIFLSARRILQYVGPFIDRLLLDDARSLVEIWFKWEFATAEAEAEAAAAAAKKAAAERKAAAAKRPAAEKKAAGDDEDGADDGAGREARDPLTTYERFLFLGECVRNRHGLFPCPKAGALKLLPAAAPARRDDPAVYLGGDALAPGLWEFRARFDGHVSAAYHPVPEEIRSEALYPLAPVPKGATPMHPAPHRGARRMAPDAPPRLSRAPTAARRQSRHERGGHPSQGLVED